MPEYKFSKTLSLESNQKLADAWDRSDTDGYGPMYRDFIAAMDLELLAQDNHPESFAVKSATNGAHLGRRITTPETQTPEILARARKAQSLWSKLPIEFRQGLLTFFTSPEGSFNNIIDAAAVAQTANMGKTIQESRAEISGKGAEWFRWAASKTVRDYITDYRATHTSEALDIRNENGEPIKTKAELNAATAVHVTKYRKTPNQDLPQTITGSGISVEQPATNYVATAMPGLSVPFATGNVVITKVPSKTPDAFTLINSALLHDARDYMTLHAEALPAHVKAEVNLTKEDTRETILAGLSQVVTSRGWERHANSYRLVGGFNSGLSINRGRKESPHLTEQDRQRSIFELAGDNPVYMDDLPPEKLAAYAANLHARISSNSGMTCTRANLTLVKEGPTHDMFGIHLVSVFEDYDANAEKFIGNPHRPETKQGALISEDEYRSFADYLNFVQLHGAIVTGGRRILEHKGGVYTTPALVRWPEGTKHVYEELRTRGKEIFAPITNLMAVKDEREAIRVINLSKNNLSSAVLTQDMRIVDLFVTHTNLGSINVNNFTKFASDNSPKGGHVAHYVDIGQPGDNTQGPFTTISHNGPTGGVAHVAFHMNVTPPKVEKALMFTGKDGAAWLAANGCTPE